MKGDRIAARVFDQCGNLVSGLDLEECGEDGHQVANKLWKIAGYLKRRAVLDEGEALDASQGETADESEEAGA